VSKGQPLISTVLDSDGSTVTASRSLRPGSHQLPSLVSFSFRSHPWLPPRTKLVCGLNKWKPNERHGAVKPNGYVTPLLVVFLFLAMCALAPKTLTMPLMHPCHSTTVCHTHTAQETTGSGAPGKCGGWQSRRCRLYRSRPAVEGGSRPRREHVRRSLCWQ
jgi:hypothetical protein